MEWWKILLIVVGVLLGLLVILSSIIFTVAGKMIVKMLGRGDGMKGVKMDVSFYDQGPLKALAAKGLEFMDSIPHEDIYITSFDGLKLHAYLFRNPNQKDNRYLLGMHGFKSGPRHEFAPYIEEYFKLGFSLLCPDERCHYMSEGEHITMGVNERYDVKAWLEYMVNNLGSDINILVEGVSMGAASVCMASELDLPRQVMGIVSDCAYSTFLDQIRFTLKTQIHMPEFPMLRIMNMYTKRVGLDLYGRGPIDAVKNAKVPILFMHGKLDEIVPVDLAYKLYEACGSRKELYIVPDANHAESEARNIPAYFNKIKEFYSL